MPEQISVKRKRSEKRQRTKRIHIRLTDEEFSHALEQADVAGVKPSRLARELLNGTNIRPAKKLPKEVYRAIISFGNNLNQLTRAANSGHLHAVEEIEALKREARAIVSCLSRS